MGHINHILPTILTWLTGRKRYKPDIVWSHRSWTHNIFRAYESIFWRRSGVRREVSLVVEQGRVTYQFHTVEAALAHIEGLIRGLKPYASPIKIYLPQLAAPTNALFPSPYLFAIAYDNSHTPTTFGASPRTASLTVSGSDRLLLMSGYQVNDNLVAPTYNSVSSTLIAKTSFPGSARVGGGLYRLIAPATGTNTAEYTSSSGNLGGVAISYTGVDQTTPIDSNAVNNSGGSTSITLTTTVVASNCWLVGIEYDTQGGGYSGGAGTTIRQTSGNGMALADSNGTVSTGSQSLIINYTSGGNGAGVIVSIAPVTSTAHTKTLTETATATASIINTAGKNIVDAVTATDTFSRVWTMARTCTEAATAAATIIKTLTRTLIEAITSADEVTNAQPQTAGPNSPGTASQTVTAQVNDWSSVNNILASDNAYATVTISSGDINTYSESLLATNFGFAIPSTATVDGIVVEVEKKSSAADKTTDKTVQLIKGGTIGGTNKAVTNAFWGTSDAYASYGSSTDLWGQAWSPSDINASDFGIAFAADHQEPSASTASVDHIRITIHYTLSGNLYTETYTEAVTAADTAIKTATKLLSEAVTAAADFTRVWTIVRTLTEATTATSTIIRVSTRVLAEAVTATDVIDAIKTKATTLADTVTAADAAIRSTIRQLTESITATDAFEGFRGIFGTFSDTVSATDAITRAMTRAIADAAQATDSVIRTTTRALSDTASAADALIRTATKTLAEAISGTDTFSRVVSFTRTLTESVTATDIIRKARNGLTVLWSNVAKSASTFTKSAKSLATWTDQPKSSTSFTKTTKSTSIWTDQAKPPTMWDNQEKP